NLPGSRKVAVVDRKTRAVVESWSTGGPLANYPMALNERDHRLFVVTRLPARLIVLDIQVAGSNRNHLQDTKIEVDVWKCREGIASIAERAGGEGVDMFSIAVEPGDWACSEAARDAENGRKLQPGKSTHHRSWIRIRGSILWVVEFWAYEPKGA